MSTPPSDLPPANFGKAVILEPDWLSSFQGLWAMTWRRKLTVHSLLGLVIGMLALPTLAYFSTEAGDEKVFYYWLINFYLQVVAPLYCLAAFGDLIRDEVQSDTLSFLVTRPVSRSKLFLLKFFAQMLFVQIVLFLAMLLFNFVGILREIPGLGKLMPIFLGVQILSVLVYGALSSLFGLLARKYLVLGIVYGFVVELGIALIPTNINNLAMSRNLRTLLANDETVKRLYSWSAGGTPLAIAILFFATVLFLSLGALLFTYREYHSAEEAQK